MTSLIFGAILLALPFLAMSLFTDKKAGFVTVLLFWILFNVSVAIITQFFGIFYYGVIIGLILVADLILLFFIFKTGKLRVSNFKFRISSLRKIDWVLIFVIIVGFLTLYQVHFNYTGKINLATDKTVSYHEVKNMQYVYPYFSDEWYAVSLVKEAISSHSLPVINPFDKGHFLNLELFFHAFVSEIFLVLSLDPLTAYTTLSILFNLLILVLVYLILRQKNISQFICGITSLSVLYITCGANVPGLWHFIPFNLGLILFLALIYFVSVKNLKMAGLAFVVAVLFYPPMFIFNLLSLIYAFLDRKKINREKLLKILGYLLIVIFIALPILSLILLISPLSGQINYIFSRVFFVSFFAPYMPQYAIYNIIIWPIILLATIGIYEILKREKLLFFQFLLGILLWCIYSLTVWRFMIEYERVVIIVGVIITIMSAFGLQGMNSKYIKIAEIIVLLLFLVFLPFYTQRETWISLSLRESNSGLMGYPKAPANNYLTKEDLKIFDHIKKAKFLSLPWKGTVVGVATGNLPAVTKEGTISMGKEASVYEFMQANCQGKKDIARNLNLQYVYLQSFDCQGFEKIKENKKEGLILYEVN